LGLVVFALLPTARAEVADELARMLAKHPEADANRDGTLTARENTASATVLESAVAEPSSFILAVLGWLTLLASRKRDYRINVMSLDGGLDDVDESLRAAANCCFRHEFSSSNCLMR
jgi:hypothetical protein